MQRAARRNRPRVFVCSPYSGDVTGNITRARNYCRFVYEQGGIPFAPHLLFPQFLDDSKDEERNAGIDAGVGFMSMCHEVWCFGKPTLGMCYELSEARRMDKPVRFFDTQMREVYAGE